MKDEGRERFIRHLPFIFHLSCFIARRDAPQVSFGCQHDLAERAGRRAIFHRLLGGFQGEGPIDYNSQSSGIDGGRQVGQIGA